MSLPSVAMNSATVDPILSSMFHVSFVMVRRLLVRVAATVIPLGDENNRAGGYRQRRRFVSHLTGQPVQLMHEFPKVATADAHVIVALLNDGLPIGVLETAILTGVMSLMMKSSRSQSMPCASGFRRLVIYSLPCSLLTACCHVSLAGGNERCAGATAIGMGGGHFGFELIEIGLIGLASFRCLNRSAINPSNN